VGVGLFALAAASWCFVRGMVLFVPMEQALLWERLSIGVASVHASTFILLTYYLFNKKLSRYSIALIYFPAVFFGAGAFSSQGILSVSSVLPLVRTTGTIYSLFNLWLMSFLIWGLIRVGLKYATLKGIIKLQAQYFLIGLLFYVFTALILGGILPRLGISQYITVLPYFSIFWVAATVYAISTQRLLGFEVTFYRVASGALVIGSSLVINFAFWQLFEHVFKFNTFISINLSLFILGTIYGFTTFRTKIWSSLENIMLKKRVKYQHLLFETSKAVVNILDINRLLRYIVNAINESLGAEKIAIFLSQNVGEKGQKLRLIESFGIEKNLGSYYLNENIVKQLETKKQTLMVDNAWMNLPKIEFDELINGLAPLGALLIVPLIHNDILVGVITLDQKRADGAIFDIQDIEIIETLANTLAPAIVNATLYTKLDNSYMQIIRALSNALETKDAYTIGHSDNVTKYAFAIAKKMQMGEKEINVIVQAAMLHDLGKIGVHDYILTKPAKLTPEEWEEIKLHSLKSAEILQPMPFLKEVSEMIKYHHERFDGKGYPEGIKGPAIPLGAQILAVADSFDAMIMERAYRGAKTKLTLQEAIQEMIDCSGTQFNSNIVQVFIEILRENPNIVLSAQVSRHS
jgi:putative nucleotidyltransferase with HDIG domain